MSTSQAIQHFARSDFGKYADLSPAERDTYRRAAAELSDVEGWPDETFGEIAARYTGRQGGLLWSMLVHLLFGFATDHMNSADMRAVGAEVRTAVRTLH